MLELGIDVYDESSASGQHQFGPQQWRVGAHRRCRAERRPQEHASLPPGTTHRGRGMVLETRLDVARSIRQRHPELHPVQGGRVRRRHLGVADAATARHQVELAGTHRCLAPNRVSVLDLAIEQPTDRLQPGMRMRSHTHPAGCLDVVGTVVVDEAPGADQGAAALRQRTPYSHRARTTQRDLPRDHHLHDVVVQLPHLGSVGSTILITTDFDAGVPLPSAV